MTAELSTLTKEVPAHFADGLRALLTEEANAQQLTWVDSGRFPMVKFTISAPVDVIQALRPKIEAWESDEMSGDVW